MTLEEILGGAVRGPDFAAMTLEQRRAWVADMIVSMRGVNPRVAGGEDCENFAWVRECHETQCVSVHVGVFVRSVGGLDAMLSPDEARELCALIMERVNKVDPRGSN